MDAMDLIVSGTSHLGDPDPTVVVEDEGSGDDSVSLLSVDERLKLGSKDQSKRSFADAVGSSGVTQANLEFFPLADKTQCQVKIPLELAKKASASFLTTFGFSDAMLNENGIFFFKFETVGGANQVADLGSVMVSGVPFFLLPWDPTKGLSKPQHHSCPLWVKIHNIPLIAFNKEGISRIASALGVPKFMDACTTYMCDKAWGRPGFAKILIDVWAVGELKKELEIVIPSLSGGDDLKVALRVEYVWEPIQCSHCLVFGHRTTNYASKVIGKKDKGKSQMVDDEGFQKVVKKKWVPKKALDGMGGSDSNPSVDPSTKGVVDVSVPNKDGQDSSKKSNDAMGGTPSPIEVAVGSPNENLVDTNKGENVESSTRTVEVPNYVCFTRGAPDPQLERRSSIRLRVFRLEEVFLFLLKHLLLGLVARQMLSRCWQIWMIRKAACMDGRVMQSWTIRGRDLHHLMFKLSCWNIRGLNATVKQKEVWDLISNYGLSLCALVETHVRGDVLPRVANDVFGSWRWISNIQAMDTAAHILIAWDECVCDVMAIDLHEQFLHCFVKLRGGSKAFFITVVYGSNSMVERKELWSGLRKAKVLMGDKPWVVVGDFSSILFPHDGFGGCSRRNPSMEDFFHCVEDIEIFDINYSGIQYTWVQKPRGGDGLLRKLDRIMSNTQFLSLFEGSSVVFATRCLSDHACGILEVPAAICKRTRGFKFDNFMTDHAAFLDIVAQEWGQPVYGSFMHRILCHLKRLKQPLHKIRNQVGDVSVRANKLRIELDAIHLAYDMDPTNPILMEDLAHVSLAYEHARNDELLYFKQRAKVRWLHDSDKNTKFFHHVVKERQNRNLIRSIMDSQGRYVHDEEVGALFVDHFRSFLGMRDPVVDPMLPDDFFNKSLSLSDSLHMIRPIVDDEIKWAMFNIGAVHNFFYSGNLFKQLNHTLLCFIPKVPNATRVTDFRPISCCNVLYKVISKIIVERMKSFLSQLIGTDQSAFIPGRRISDNILMAHELVAGYQRDVGQPRCAFKIDLRKAYDTVDWRFLLRMLQGFSFHPVFCKWIDQMLSTSSFSIALNGETFGFFKGARGLRQGDPISPYLFTIVMECFSMIFRQCIVEARDFRYHQGCDELSITHLCFADDLFVFTGGDLASVEVVKRALDRFRLVSGLESNLAKSEVFFCNVAPEVRTAIRVSLPLNPGTFPIRYLGVPLSQIRLKVMDFVPLVNKVKARIHDWKSKFLSFGGRKQLIVSVLQSMQLYWLMIYVLPSAVTHEPIASGGLGFKRLGVWNRAFIAKHVWDLLTHRNSLWVNWIGRDLLVTCNGAWPDMWVSLNPLTFSLPPPIISESVDVLKWRGVGGIGIDFSVKEAWRSLSGAYQPVVWTKFVWFKGHVPKHGFCMWTACHGRLPTQDRIGIWMHEISDLRCPLCEMCADSHDHLSLGVLFLVRFGGMLREWWACMVSRKFGVPLWITLMTTVDLARCLRDWRYRVRFTSFGGRGIEGSGGDGDAVVTVQVMMPALVVEVAGDDSCLSTKKMKNHIWFRKQQTLCFFFFIGDKQESPPTVATTGVAITANRRYHQCGHHRIPPLPPELPSLQTAATTSVAIIAYRHYHRSCHHRPSLPPEWPSPSTASTTMSPSSPLPSPSI
ncbi:hypothetical protein OSB04_028595 [Centaurea solstitialis]|uniref:Reverse transcriptase domain-containing protein n=1 Tax=Centaurea solstitialis TaxID=347529 RepID=A0AA38W9F0_9ASTR|nr:hypothetical protein OSB04_028595 [Centaurea solstitialis]